MHQLRAVICSATVMSNKCLFVRYFIHKTKKKFIKLYLKTLFRIYKVCRIIFVNNKQQVLGPLNIKYKISNNKKVKLKSY